VVQLQLGTMIARCRLAFKYLLGARAKMRLLSSILLVLLLFQAVVCLPTISGVAPQAIQQSQSSDAIKANQATLDKPAVLQIPDGTLVEVEAPYTYSSMHFKPKDEISFRVVNPIMVNGITVIEKGATATGRIEKSKRGGHFGKAGLLLWTMETVTAVDGSQISLRTNSVRLRGDSKGAKVATQMIITGALLWPIAPVTLLHGFKRGKDAFIPAGKRYEVFIDGQPSVKLK
jgi:hypothetical protein